MRHQAGQLTSGPHHSSIGMLDEGQKYIACHPLDLQDCFDKLASELLTSLPYPKFKSTALVHEVKNRVGRLKIDPRIFRVRSLESDSSAGIINKKIIRMGVRKHKAMEEIFRQSKGPPIETPVRNGLPFSPFAFQLPVETPGQDSWVEGRASIIRKYVGPYQPDPVPIDRLHKSLQNLIRGQSDIRIKHNKNVRV